MKFDMVVGGVGGQGILSIAFVMDNASLAEGVHFKQSEVHGMAQRGGAVSTHMRISDAEIFSDLVPLGSADMILAVEPMEALRYVEYLAPGGRIVTSTATEENIPDYPSADALLTALLGFERVVLLNGRKVAKESGSHRAQNIVMLGAAAPYLPLGVATMEKFIGVLFERKGEKVVKSNLDAFRAGRAHGEFFVRAVELGADPKSTLALLDRVRAATVDPSAAARWVELLTSPRYGELLGFLEREPNRMLAATAETADAILRSGPSAIAGA
jgi:indolepyruvate ferredoxin oxidoreductase beta subunit